MTNFEYSDLATGVLTAESPESATYDFSSALELLRAGFAMARVGWNGKGMFIYLTPGSTFPAKNARPPLPELFPGRSEFTYQPHIDMFTADGTLVPWLASQSDLLATDWAVV